MAMLPPNTTATRISTLVLARAEELFRARRQANYIQIDKMFGVFLVVEWLAGIITAVVFSPLTWAGRNSDVNAHVIEAAGIGGLIVIVPILLVMIKPGGLVTRHCVAIAQMAFTGLLIHLTGGRIETHFYIFCSLAFLAFYRDWPVLIMASFVVAADHVIRGIYYPLSIYGINEMQPMRWVEHAWWVIAEDAIIIFGNRKQVAEMRSIALKQAEVEETKGQVAEVEEERLRERNQYEQARYAEFAKNAHLSSAVNLSDKPIIGQNKDGTIFGWNHAASLLFGFSEAEIIGKHIKILAPSRKQTEMDDLITKGKGGTVIARMETARLTKAGKPVAVVITRTPIRDSNGNILGVTEFVHESGTAAVGNLNPVTAAADKAY
jgi:PAS domain S-box-containing protein